MEDDKIERYAARMRAWRRKSGGRVVVLAVTGGTAGVTRTQAPLARADEKLPT